MDDAENADSKEFDLLPDMRWVCRILGVSKARVETLVTRGDLSQPTRRGKDLIFVEEEVLALVGKMTASGKPGRKKKRTEEEESELYAHLFDLFKQGKTFQEIVMSERKILPSFIRKARLEYELGFKAPPDYEFREKMMLMAERGRLRSTELEIVQARLASKERLALNRRDAESRKEHSRIIESFKGGIKQ